MRFGPVVPVSGMAARITCPGVVLGVYSQRCRPSATMRSPRGLVNRMAKRLGRIWYSLPCVVSAPPMSGFATTCVNSAASVRIV